MRSLEELKEIYQQLSLAGACADGWCSDSMIAGAIKRLFVLCSLVYPEYMSEYDDNVIHLDNKGQLMDGSWNLEDSGELIYQYAAGDSSVTDYLLCYYMNSPYWDVDFDHLMFSDYDNEADMDAAEFLKLHNGCFEQALMDALEAGSLEEHPLWKYYKLFEKEEECSSADDVVVLASKLLPLYQKVREEALEVDRKLCITIDSTEKTLLHWLSGYSFTICEKELEKKYYINCDGSSYCLSDGYGAGVLEADLPVLVAGDIIDRCIFELDKKLHFIPEEVKALAVSEKGVAAA